VFYDSHTVTENRQQDLILELHKQKIYPEPSRPNINHFMIEVSFKQNQRS